MPKLTVTFRKGGSGSGHHGHRGRPGKRGGSSSGIRATGSRATMSGRNRAAIERKPAPIAQSKPNIAEHSQTMKRAIKAGDARVTGNEYVARVEFGQRGISGVAIIHPEHVNKIRSLKDGETTSFNDEQKMTWSVSRGVYEGKDSYGFVSQSQGSGLAGVVRASRLEEYMDNIS